METSAEEEVPTKADVPTRATVYKSGVWGSNLTWTIYNDGVMTISGTGAMANISYSSSAPWYSYRYKFTSVVVEEGVTSVEQYAFSGNTYLQSITLADSVTTVEARAFYDCSKLTTVDLGGVTTIGERTFYECENLQNVTLSKDLTEIGDYAFYKCAVRSVSVPNVTVIGSNAFYYCTALRSIDLSENLVSIGEDAFYNTGLTELVIPDSVTTIGPGAFTACDSLTSVVLGDGLTQISYQAFKGCDLLEEVVIGKNVEIIGSYAFEDCIALKEVYIPDSVTKINSYAFDSCKAITDVYLGSGLREEYCISSDAFKFCESIANVWYRGTQEQWTAMRVTGSSYQFTHYLTDANRYYMMGACGEQVWWDVAFDGTMTIAGSGPMFDYGGDMGWPEWNDNVFTKVKKIVVEPGVTTIGNESFGWMENLTEVVLPEGLTKIGDYSFSYSTALKTVKLPASVTEYGVGAFDGCTVLDGIWADKDSKYFYNDSHGVLFSKDGVLLQAPASLKGVYDIPAGTTAIAPYAFSSCFDLTLVNYPDSVTSIGKYAFYRCTGLTKLNIPDTVTEIGAGAFCMCTGLETLDIPKGITKIEDVVFDECFGLTEIVIPDNITEIGESAFFDCFNVKTVTIPDSVTTIKDYAFAWLWALESVTIPNSVTYMGVNAFEECTALKSVNLGTGLTTLEESTFSGCVALEEVYIPKSIVTIVAGAFNGCEALSTVWYNGTEDEWNIMEISTQGNEYLQGVRIQYLKDQGNCGTGVNWRMMQDGSLVIFGNGAMNDYSQTAAPWAAYQEEIEYLQVADGVTSVGANAFAGLTKLVYAELRDDVATIGESAFSGCSALPAIGFPASVTEIAANAFSGCSSLEEVYLPSQLISIGDRAFAGCTKLPSVELPAALTEIGAGASADCKTLTAISIPAAVVVIGENAFNGCTALANISVAEENAAYCTDAQGVLYNAEKTQLLLAPTTLSGSYVVPAGVVEIAANAFGTKNLTAITIPASLKTVGQNAFLACRKLASVRYYDSVNQWNAISVGTGNDRLLNAKIVFTEASGTCGENLTWELETNGILMISGTGAMNDYDPEGAPWAELAGGIRTLEIGDGVTSIGSNAFAGCTALGEVRIPDSVTSIGAKAFCDCSELAVAYLGDGVAEVDPTAFSGCQELRTVYVGAGLAVNAETFAECTSLENIHIAEDNAMRVSVNGLVYSWNGATLLAVPKGRSGNITLSENATVVGIDSFAGSSVTSVTLHEGITSIDNYAFKDSLLKEVVLPETLMSIGDEAFANTRLQVIKLPATVNHVGAGAFAGCAQLTSVALSSGLTSVAEDAFFGCSSLNAVTIPASVKSIESNAFEGCTSLSMVSFMGTPEEFAAIEIGSGNDALNNAQIVVGQTVSVVAAPYAVTGKPQIQWEAVEGVTKYEVHRATALDGKYKKLKSVSATTYTDTSASAGKEYYYKIKALYGKTAVEIGTAASVCVCAQPKVSVSVSTSTAQPTLKWSKVSGASKYIILRATAPDGEYTELATQKGTSFTDKNADFDAVYYYKVNIIPSKANTECVDPAPVRVVTSIAKPSIKVTANENGKPQITCEELSGAVSYVLYRSASKKGTYTQLMVSGEPVFVDNSAEIGTTYYYKVSATGRNSESVQSNYGSVRCVAVSPEITVVRSDATGKAVITWDAVEGAKKYEIYRSTKENSGYKKISTTDKLSYQDTGASVGKTYYYRVYTVPSSSKAKSMPSNIGSVYAICAQPVLKVSYSASGQHTISWSKVSGAKTYEIWRSDAENGLFIRLANQKGTSYTDKDTQPDTVYYYYVNAIASKPENDSIEADPVKIARAITAPKISAGNDEYGKPVITWDAVEGAVRYKIYRATSSKGTYTLVGNVTGTSYTNERVEVGSRYYYKVSALGNNCESAMSSYDDTYAKLPAPVIVSGEQDLASGKPVLRWNTVDGAKKYDIYRATSADGKYSKIKSGVTGYVYTDTSAKNNTTYYYKVVSVASNSGANSVLSGWYSVTSGNISASDAKVRELLIKMERYPAYLRIEYTILLLRIERYQKYDDSASVYADVLDSMSNVYEYISKTAQICGSNRSLKMLKDECRDTKWPVFNGSFDDYVSQGKKLARAARDVVIIYNVICKSYGLPGVGNVEEP